MVVGTQYIFNQLWLCLLFIMFMIIMMALEFQNYKLFRDLSLKPHYSTNEETET